VVALYLARGEVAEFVLEVRKVLLLVVSGPPLQVAILGCGPVCSDDGCHVLSALHWCGAVEQPFPFLVQSERDGFSFWNLSFEADFHDLSGVSFPEQQNWSAP
jgi:hypothetical protein